MVRLIHGQIFPMCVLLAAVSGCSDSPPPEKTIEQKLDSTDPAEQMRGLEEAEQKYGGGKQ